MNPTDYIKGVLKTESPVTQEMVQRISDKRYIRIEHAASGMVTEAGEFKDALKKHIYYGKELDEVNLKEELGDILWYIAVACDVLETSFEELMEINHNKLKTRYGEKFTEEAAENRDLYKEREILENKSAEIVVQCTSNHLHGRGCGKKFPIKDLIYIQTHWYEPPVSCTAGDYWNEGEGQFICPECGHRNRLHNRPEIQELKYKFKSIDKEYTK